MKQRCWSKFLFWLAMLGLILLNLTSSVEARGMNDGGLLSAGRVVDASSSMVGKERLRRQLQTPTTSSAATSSATDDDTTSDSKTDDDITTVNKSIASRTSSVTSNKKDLGSSMSIRFVKPQTAAPTVPPPSSPPTLKPVAKKAPSATSNSTLTKAGPAMSSNSTVSSPSSRATYPPTTENPESIASKTATDGTPKVPLSDSMEFETAETSPPNSTHTNYTQNANGNSWASTNATETDKDEDGYIPSNGTSSYSDDSVSTYSPHTSTSAPKILYFTEQKQPESWPEIVGLLFVAAAFGFFGATAVKDYLKRKEYEKIPESLIV